jgi:hypothetical protein
VYAKVNGGKYDFIVERRKMRLGEKIEDGGLAVPLDQSFWDDLMSDRVARWNLTTYEQVRVSLAVLRDDGLGTGLDVHDDRRDDAAAATAVARSRVAHANGEQCSQSWSGDTVLHADAS